MRVKRMNSGNDVIDSLDWFKEWEGSNEKVSWRNEWIME